MSVKPALTAGHVTTAAEYTTIIDQAWRGVPVKGVNVTNIGAPIATTSAGTEMDLAKLQLTSLSLTTNRYYLARYLLSWTKTVAGDVFDAKLRVNTAVSGTQIGQSGFDFTNGRGSGTQELTFLFKGDASYTGLFLSVVRFSGAGTFSYHGAIGTFNHTYGMLFDHGDSDNWADVA